MEWKSLFVEWDASTTMLLVVRAGTAKAGNGEVLDTLVGAFGASFGEASVAWLSTFFSASGPL